MKVRYWGVRGSIPVPGIETARYGGNSSCIEVRAEGQAPLVLDCGTGARNLGCQLMMECVF
jgi:phosphoribosyl 1,2-cyclic phosphodiesterase